MDIKTGQLDYTYPTLIPLLNSELFGEIQDEKEAEDKKKNFTEIKKNKAVETYSLLAQTMEFKNSFMPLIGYLQDQMQGDHQTKSYLKIEEVLRHILEGLQKNTSIEIEDLILYCYTLIEDAFSNIKIKEDLIELNENMTKDKNRQNKITKYEVLKV